MLIILYMSTMINIMALSMSHPLSLGMCLFLQTVIYSLTLGLISSNFWFSYILFLMMISGMLILFMYMTSIISNKKFNFSKINIMITLISMILIISLVNFNYTPLNLNYNININMSITNFFNTPMIYLMMIMMIYLFVTLIATVKIINIKSGPLRQKF